jgi:hypothetical protein
MNDSSGERPEPRWARALEVALVVLVCAGLFSAAWRLLRTGLPWMGLLLLGVALVTAFLAIRRHIRSRPRTNLLGIDESGELRSPAFDYLVWSSIGVPFILIVGLLVFVLTGAR